MSRGTWSPEARRRAKRRREAAEHRIATARGRELRTRSRQWVGSLGGRSSATAPSISARPTTGATQPSVLPEGALGRFIRMRAVSGPWDGPLAFSAVPTVLDSAGWNFGGLPITFPDDGTYRVSLFGFVGGARPWNTVELQIDGEVREAETTIIHPGRLHGIWSTGPVSRGESVELHADGISFESNFVGVLLTIEQTASRTVQGIPDIDAGSP